jgi:hypothetical protein
METVSLSDIDADASSLALEPLETDEMKRAGIGPKDAKDKQARMSKGARRAFDILKNVLSEYGQTGVVTDLSRSVRCVKKSIWRDNYLSESPLGKGSANRSFDRAKESLWTSRTIAGFGEYVWISIDYGEGEK